MTIRDDLQSRLRTLRAWAFEIIKDNLDGWPATQLSQVPGVWTTAQFIRALAISHTAEPLSPAELKAISGPARWLLSSQLADGGWPLIGGETPGILATAAAIRGVNALIRWLPVDPELASEALFALQRGSRWLLLRTFKF